MRLTTPRNTSARELANIIGVNRRDFLRAATGAGAATLLQRSGIAEIQSPRRKAVIVTFGGGARDEETFMPDGHENIPYLLHELIPQGTFFSQVVNRGILGHYVATASIVTGTYETFNNFATTSPENPTAFEYFRKDRKRPPTDAWVVAPSNGFSRIGESDHRLYGAGQGGGVVLPKRLLGAALHNTSEQKFYDHLLKDNYETPIYAPALAGHEAELHQMANVLKLSSDDFAAHARTLASPDEMSVYVAKHLMNQFAPSLLWITLHDIDIAHAGAFSLYLNGIQRSDRLCADLWKTIQNHPEYKDRTTMLILPDFGRDSDMDPGGNGFQHHRTGDPMSRTTWMLAMGPGVRQNTIVTRQVESIDVVPTLGSLLGFEARFSKGKPIAEIV